MKPFREIHSSDVESSRLQSEMDVFGYVLIRELAPASHVELLLDQILEIVAEGNWLQSNHSPLERLVEPAAACGDSDSKYKHVYERIFNLQAFHAFPHHPALRTVMKDLVGPRLVVHPKPIGRLIFPHCDRFVVDAHQDHQSIAGEPGSYTAWIPLHDCPIESGPLQILEASHRYGLQSCDAATGIISKETARGGDWVGGQINMGDVLIFRDLTVHAASPNTSDQLRISIDCRFQDFDRALNPANLVFPGSNGRSWEETYANWRSDELKYYWRQLPLKLKPSLAELAELSHCAETSKMRSRYARILMQLESQLQTSMSLGAG